MAKVCVFGSSSKSTSDKFVAESARLGELIAEYGHICVNGAGRFGCMGGMNDGCKRKNGQILGIIHRQFCVDFKEHPIIKDLVIVDGADLYERKLQLFNNADCLIVLPGGVGTFDEFWDGVSAKSLGMKDMTHKPICIVNVDGFYDGFIMQMERAFQEGILYHSVEEYFHVASDAESALTWCLDELAKPKFADAGSNKLARIIDRSTNLSAKTEANTGTSIDDDLATSATANTTGSAYNTAITSSVSSGNSNDTGSTSSGTGTGVGAYFPTSTLLSLAVGLVIGFTASRLSAPSST